MLRSMQPLMRSYSVPTSPSAWLATHVDALRAAGFGEVGTLWQRGNNRILCAVASG